MSDLPAGLAAAIRRLADGEGNLAASAERISTHYRQRGASRQVIGSEADVLAYALSRMPATYAAVSAVLDELSERAPDFAPDAMLDMGAGPGTAAWAAATAYPGIDATLVDHNQRFLAMAGALAADAGVERLQVQVGELTGFTAGRTFPLVTCAYALTELDDDAMRVAAERLWSHSSGVLVIVEPGRPRDYQRLLRVREQLIGQGAEVLAPCPHEHACPLVEPDWCHFSARLSRSRDHMRMKGGTLGYEDEKYSYLVLARPGIGMRAGARVLRPPFENKFSVTLPLCTPDGLEERAIASRDKAAFKAARKLDWGDAL
jgi:ribosomal protein RSM22 (predicted rRNA methylase)